MLISTNLDQTLLFVSIPFEIQLPEDINADEVDNLFENMHQEVEV